MGYAIASRKEIALVCSDERDTPFPFDVRHRSIIKYSTESSSDYEQLRDSITKRLEAMTSKASQLGDVARLSAVATVEGLDQIEIAALVATAQQFLDPVVGVTAYQIKSDMQKAGFATIATVMGIRQLVAKKMLLEFENQDSYNGETFTAYRVTDSGMNWLYANQSKLELRAAPKISPPPDSDLPF